MVYDKHMSKRGVTVNDAREQSEASWRQLEQGWREIQEAWHDDTTAYFATEFWHPLESELKTYLQIQDQILSILQVAQRIAGER
jgi:hypothetical protein